MKRITLLLLAVTLTLAQSPLKTATISLSAQSGDIQIIAPVATGTTIKLWKVVIALAAATNITYVQGQGTNCATGRAVMSGAMNSVQYLVDPTPVNILKELGPGNAFCINFSGASTGGGYVDYSN